MKSIKEFILELIPFIIGSMVFAYIVFIGILIGRLMETNLTGKGDVSFWEMLSAIGSVLGAIAVPIALACWVSYNEKKRDEEQRKREDRAIIYRLIENKIYPITKNFIPYSKFIGKEHVFDDIWNALASFETLISHTVYNFVGKECRLLTDIILAVKKFPVTDTYDLHVFYIDLLDVLDTLEVVFLDRKTYEKRKIGFFIGLLLKEGILKKITEEILEKNNYTINIQDMSEIKDIIEK